MAQDVYNRRRFLQVAGATSAFAIAGCSDREFTPTSPGESPLELTLESSAPITANGRDTAEVRIEATDEDGEPMTGLTMRGFFMEGDDILRPVSIEEEGGGRYSAAVSSEHAGTNVLEVTAEELTVAARLEIPFEPGPPDHVWLVNERPPQLDDSDLTAKFELMLKDENDNLIAPDNADYRVTSQHPNATFEQQPLPEKDAVRVKAGLEEAPTPDDGMWSEFEVRVDEQATGDTTTTRLEFPMIDAVKRQRWVNGEAVTSITLYSVNVRPLESYSIFVPFDDDRMELVSVDDPDPQAEFPSPDVERTPEGVLIKAEGVSDKPTTGLATLDFRYTADAGSIDLPIDIEQLKFRAVQPIRFRINLPLKLLVANTICLKIWMFEGTDEDDVDADVESMREVFTDARENCCPVLAFDIEREEISSDEWGEIDDDGDGELDFGSGEEERESEATGETITVADKSDEEAALLENHREEDCVNVYYVPKLPSIGGFSYYGRSYPELTAGGKWSWDTDGAQNGDMIVVGNNGGAGNEKTLAHELGHLLGELKHPPAGAPGCNIMYQTGDDMMVGTFSEEQCEKLSELQG